MSDAAKYAGYALLLQLVAPPGGHKQVTIWQTSLVYDDGRLPQYQLSPFTDCEPLSHVQPILQTWLATVACTTAAATACGGSGSTCWVRPPVTGVVRN